MFFEFLFKLMVLPNTDGMVWRQKAVKTRVVMDCVCMRDPSRLASRLVLRGEKDEITNIIYIVLSFKSGL